MFSLFDFENIRTDKNFCKLSQDSKRIIINDYQTGQFNNLLTVLEDTNFVRLNSHNKQVITWFYEHRC